MLFASQSLRIIKIAESVLLLYVLQFTSYNILLSIVSALCFRFNFILIQLFEVKLFSQVFLDACSPANQTRSLIASRNFLYFWYHVSELIIGLNL